MGCEHHHDLLSRPGTVPFFREVLLCRTWATAGSEVRISTGLLHLHATRGAVALDTLTTGGPKR